MDAISSDYVNVLDSIMSAICMVSGAPISTANEIRAGLIVNRTLEKN